MGSGLNDGADDEEDVADDEGPLSADLVGDDAGAEGGDDGADGERRGDEFLVAIGEGLAVEIGADLDEDGGDGAGVVSEEETADGGEEGEAPEVERVALALACSLDGGLVENAVEFCGIDDALGGDDGAGGYVELVEVIEFMLAVVGELLVVGLDGSWLLLGGGVAESRSLMMAGTEVLRGVGGVNEEQGEEER